jgi:hypothetical protein
VEAAVAFPQQMGGVGGICMQSPGLQLMSGKVKLAVPGCKQSALREKT